MNSGPFPFNRIVVKGEGAAAEYSIGSFMVLPLHQRIRFILEGKVEFFFGEKRIAQSVALKSLRDIASGRSTDVH